MSSLIKKTYQFRADGGAGRIAGVVGYPLEFKSVSDAEDYRDNLVDPDSWTVVEVVVSEVSKPRVIEGYMPGVLLPPGEMGPYTSFVPADWGYSFPTREACSAAIARQTGDKSSVWRATFTEVL